MLVSNMKKVGVKGFSLVELMVVVAIIGILAAVAIPNFQRFQRKARQSEARANLSGVHTALSAFRAEWEEYTSDLFLAGYSPMGQLRYRHGVDVTVDSAIYNGAQPQDNTRNQTNHAIFTEADELASACALPAGTAVTNTAGSLAFVAASCGGIGGGNDDHWTINQNKNLQNIQDGVSD